MGQSTLSVSHSKGPQQAGEVNKNLMKFNKGKCKVYTWGGITPCTSMGWGANQPQSSLADHDTKLTVSHRVPSWQSSPAASWSALERAWPAS